MKHDFGDKRKRSKKRQINLNELTLVIQTEYSLEMQFSKHSISLPKSFFLEFLVSALF